jgi:hypothetical protein
MKLAMLPQKGTKSTKDECKLILNSPFVFFVPFCGQVYGRGLGLGVGVGLTVGFGVGSPGDGLGPGRGLPLGLGFGSGLGSGLGVGVGDGLWLGIVVGVVVDGVVDGFATSVPVAVPLLAILDVVNVHLLVNPAMGLNVSFVPLFLPRNETTGEFAPDICRATAVYPLDFEAIIRPLFPSAVVN